MPYEIVGTMEPKLSNPVALNWLKHFNVGDERSTYKVEFEIDSDLGFSGAITVTNKYDKEIFLEGFSIEGVVDIACNSWIQPEKVHPEERVFFSNKVIDILFVNCMKNYIVWSQTRMCSWFQLIFTCHLIKFYQHF